MAKAQVNSIDALKAFKVAIVKFCEAANVAMSDAEGDVSRMNQWLDHEMLTFWQGQIRTRHDELERAKEALRMKKLFKDPSGARQSYIDEQKAVERATRRLEHAQVKLSATRKWVMRFQKEAMLYQGQVQRLSGMITGDLPQANLKLSSMIVQLEAYVGLGPVSAGSTAAEPATSSAGSSGGSDAGGMARPAEETPGETPVESAAAESAAEASAEATTENPSDEAAQPAKVRPSDSEEPVATKAENGG